MKKEARNGILKRLFRGKDKDTSSCCSIELVEISEDEDVPQDKERGCGCSCR